MTISEEFGGYLPLELPPSSGEFYRSTPDRTVLRLNSGRATFFLAAKHLNARTIWLPYFTCADTAIPFERLGMRVERYLLDERLLPNDIELSEGEVLLWTNYYGNAREEEIQAVISRYSDSLIIDNCHAFFSPPRDGAVFSYSARKFLGVPDGAYLVGKDLRPPENLERGFSFEFFHHLVMQLDDDTHSGYALNLENERRLSDRFTEMSTVTQRILSSVDYTRIQRTRANNLEALDNLLGNYNNFDLNRDSKTHMYYPFQSSQADLRNKLVADRIYTPQWWKHVLEQVSEDAIEAKLSREVVLLPIDQRYTTGDMESLADRVKRALDN